LTLKDGHIVDPGPFNGEVDTVDLSEDRAEIFGSRAQYREFVRAVGGIRVYRDGFGVRTPGDWLNLGASWTGARSYYTLKPDNVIGYVDISVSDNSQLEETTDREGFQQTPAFQNFYELLRMWVSYTTELQTMLRRSWLDYVRDGRRDIAGIEPTSRPEDLLNHVDRTIRDLSKSRKPLRRARDELLEARERVRTAGRQPELDLDGVGSQRRVQEAFNALEAAAERIAFATAEIDEALAHAESERLAIAVVKDQLDVLREQLSDSWATVALGITAEALTHEMANVVDRLRGRTATIEKYLKDHDINDRNIQVYLEHVRSASSALTQQLDHLDPTLGYQRARSEVFDLSAFLADYSNFFAARYTDGTLRLDLAIVNDFAVSMSRGKLTQILDNLILNSEYWIKELQRRRKFVGIITIRCDRPSLIIRDNGPGVAASVEESLFEPFITTKSGGKRGRGLGLYVVQQLLDADGCRISLLPERDADGKRRAFEIRLDAVTRRR
jgi:signal transduction histidine kinase